MNRKMPANGSQALHPEDTRAAHQRPLSTQHLGPNAVDDHFIGQIKQLNLDGLPIGKDGSSFEDLMLDDIPPFDPNNSTLVYRGYTLFRIPGRRMFGDKPSWKGDITPTSMGLSQPELKRIIQKSKKGSVEKQLGTLGQAKRAHIDRLVRFFNRNDDRQFEWHIEYLNLNKQEVRDKENRHSSIEVLSMDVILMRKLRPGVSSRSSLDSLDDIANQRPPPRAKGYKEYRSSHPIETAGPGREPGFVQFAHPRAPEYQHDFDTPDGKIPGTRRDTGFDQFPPPRAKEFQQINDFNPPGGKPLGHPGFDQFPPPQAKVPNLINNFDAPGFDHQFQPPQLPQPQEYRPPTPIDDFGGAPFFDTFDASGFDAPGVKPFKEPERGPDLKQSPPTPPPEFGFGQGGPNQFPNGQHPMEPPPVQKQQPPAPKQQPSVPKQQPSVPKQQPSVPKQQPSVPKQQPSAPKPVPTHVPGGGQPMPPMPPSCPQPSGAYGGHPGTPGPMNGHKGTPHHNDNGPARKGGKAGEANQSFPQFGDNFPQSPNKIKRPPPGQKKYQIPSHPQRAGKADWDSDDSAYDDYDSTSSRDDDTSISDPSDFNEFKAEKPRTARGSLHYRQAHSRERIHRSHSRKHPQKSYSERYPFGLVDVIPENSVNPRRTRTFFPTTHRENRPTPAVLQLPRADHRSYDLIHDPREAFREQDERLALRERDFKDQQDEQRLARELVRTYKQKKEMARQLIPNSPNFYRHGDHRYLAARRTGYYREPYEPYDLELYGRNGLFH